MVSLAIRSYHPVLVGNQGLYRDLNIRTDSETPGGKIGRADISEDFVNTTLVVQKIRTIENGIL